MRRNSFESFYRFRLGARDSCIGQVWTRVSIEWMAYKSSCFKVYSQ